MLARTALLTAWAAVLATAAVAGRPAEPSNGPSPGQGADVDERAAPQRLALLVGIDEYAPGTARDLRPLSGCRRDVERARTLLVDLFGFPDHEVRVLLDADATLEGFVRAFDEHLLRRAGRETEVVLWYSGHGSRVPETSGRQAAEPGGMDNSLVLWDSRTDGRDGSRDLSDDLFHSLLAALTARCDRVTIVTDSCHSGAVTRSGVRPARVRAASAGTEPVDLDGLKPFWPADVPILDDDDPRRDGGSRHVHLGACGPDQLAHEIDLPSPAGHDVSHGAFSWFLTEELQRAERTTTWRTLARRAALRLANAYPGQSLWFEGLGLDRRLFSGEFEPRLPGFPARAFGPTVRIAAGRLSGLDRGSELDVFAGVGGTPLGGLRVIRASPTWADARWLGTAPDELPDEPLRVVPSGPPPSGCPLTVFVDDDELADALATSPWAVVERVDPKLADYEITGDARKGWDLITSEGYRLEGARAGPPCTAAERFDVVLAQEVTHRDLMRWSEASGGLPVEARVQPPSDADLSSLQKDHPELELVPAPIEPIGADTAGPATPSVRAPRSIGAMRQVVQVRVEVGGDEPLYVWVFSIQEDRKRELLWPDDELGRDNLVVPGEPRLVSMGLSDLATWSLERPMRDRVLVLATRKWAPFEHLERPASLTRSGSARRDVGGPFGVACLDVWVE